MFSQYDKKKKHKNTSPKKERMRYCLLSYLENYNGELERVKFPLVKIMRSKLC